MKVHITVSEAVQLAQQGDNDALIALLKQYSPIIYKGVGKAMSYGLGTEDLESIFTLEMIKMLRRFNTDNFKSEEE